MFLKYLKEKIFFTCSARSEYGLPALDIRTMPRSSYVALSLQKRDSTLGRRAMPTREKR
jgi:hypothetical protein